MSGAQQRGHEALGAVMRSGAVNRLPALAWTVAPSGDLTGQPPTSSSPGEQRTAIDLWAAHLDTHTQQTTSSDGVTRLWAPFVWRRDPGATARGEIRAEIGGAS